MAKFCSNCGTGLDEATKFCMNCGTPAPQPAASVPAQPEAPPPAPEPAPPPFPQPEQQPIYQGQLPQQPAAQPLPQYPQQPFPQQPYPQPQQPYPAAPPPKKKSKLPLVLAIVAVVVIGGIAAIVAGIVGAVNKAANADYYVLGNDQIPSVKYVLGEKRKITSASTSINNGVTMKEYQYSAPGVDQALEMSQYLTYLRGEGFLLLTDADFTVPEAWCKVGRNSVDSGYEIIVQIDYNTAGYIITLVKEEGEITPATADPTTPPNRPEPTEPAGPGPIGYDYEGQELWRGEFEDEDGVYVELFFFNDDGTFIVSIMYRDGQEEDYDLYGTYYIEAGRLGLFDVESNQGEAYNDMTFDYEQSNNIMTLDGDADYWRVADDDREYVLADPFTPYPYTSFRAD